MNQCEVCGQEIEGYQLCSPCTRATLERLRRMPSLYAALAMLLPPASRRQGGGGGSRPVEAPMPISESVLTLRGPGGIVGVLEDWQSALAEDLEDWRGLPTAARPVIGGSIETRISSAVGRMVANLEFIAASWPAAGEFARSIRDLERGVLSMISPPVRESVRMGLCPARPGGVLCGSVLKLPVGETILVCSWCNQAYPPGVWGLLRSEQDAVWRAESEAREDDAA